MPVSATSGTWRVDYFDKGAAVDIDDIDFSAQSVSGATETGAITDILSRELHSKATESRAIRFEASVTLDRSEDVALYLTAAGDANVYVDDALMIDLRASDHAMPDAESGETGAASGPELRYDSNAARFDLTEGAHKIVVEYLSHSPRGALELDWAVGDIGRLPLDLSIPAARPAPEAEAAEEMQYQPLGNIHAILTADHMLLTFGTDQSAGGSGAIVYDVWDFETKEHFTPPNRTSADVFCSVPTYAQETGDLTVIAGDTRAERAIKHGLEEAGLFNSGEIALGPNDSGAIDFARWYATGVTLAGGEIIVLGGIDTEGNGVGTPELYRPGEGAITLDDAFNEDLADGWFYPRAWPASDGSLVVIAQLHAGKMYRIEPTETGSVTLYGDLPFGSGINLPAVMYEADKFLIMANDGKVWSVDISGDAPIPIQVMDLDEPRYGANMILTPDGKVMIAGGGTLPETGGTAEPCADAVIWDPRTGARTHVDAGVLGRLSQSAALLLPDATILSLGDGWPGHAEPEGGPVYHPGYLFDAEGAPASRPVILTAPDRVAPRETFNITVAGDPEEITRVTMVKHGSVTHALSLEARFIEAKFAATSSGRISVHAPKNPHVFTPGVWMVFVWTAEGVPSHAVSVSVGACDEAYMPILGEFGALLGGAGVLSETPAPEPEMALEAPVIISGNLFKDHHPGARSELRGQALRVIGIEGQTQGPVTLESGAVVTFNPDGDYHYDPGDVFDALPEGKTAIDKFVYWAENETGDQVSQTAYFRIEGRAAPCELGGEFGTLVLGGAGTSQVRGGDGRRKPRGRPASQPVGAPDTHMAEQSAKQSGNRRASDILIPDSADQGSETGGRAAGGFFFKPGDKLVTIHDFKPGTDQIVLGRGLDPADADINRDVARGKVTITFDGFSDRIILRDIDPNAVTLASLVSGSDPLSGALPPPVFKRQVTDNSQRAVTIRVLDPETGESNALVPPGLRFEWGDNATGLKRTIRGEGVWTIDNAAGTVTFTPEARFSGRVTPIRYRVSDPSNTREDSLEIRSATFGGGAGHHIEIRNPQAGDGTQMDAETGAVAPDAARETVPGGRRHDYILPSSNSIASTADLSTPGGLGADVFVFRPGAKRMTRDGDAAAEASGADRVDSHDRIKLHGGLAIRDLELSETAGKGRICLVIKKGRDRMVIRDVDTSAAGLDIDDLVPASALG